MEEEISYKDFINAIKPELEKTLSFLKKELQSIRVGAPSPALFENIEVEYMGEKYRLSQLSIISLAEGRQIVIQPWDSSYIESIVRAVEELSSLGASPIVDGNLVRVQIPPLSEELREKMIRMVKEKKEMAKQTVRRWRGDAWKKIQKAFQEKKISEDEKYKGKDKLQELIDDYNGKIEEITKKKIEEIKS